MTPHGELQDLILDYLRLNGWWANATHSGRYHPTTKGVPDILAIREGKALFVEVKASGDQVSPTQHDVQTDLQAHGAIVVTATRLEDVFFARRIP
jgi:Holliday junction resolvase